MFNVSLLSNPNDVNIATWILELLRSIDGYIISSANRKPEPITRQFFRDEINKCLDGIFEQTPTSSFNPMFENIKASLDEELPELFSTLQGKSLFNVSTAGDLFFSDGSYYKANLPNRNTLFCHKEDGKISIYPTPIHFLSLLDKNFHYCHHFGNNLYCIYDHRSDAEIRTKNFVFSEGVFFCSTMRGVIQDIPYTQDCLKTLIEHKMI